MNASIVEALELVMGPLPASTRSVPLDLAVIAEERLPGCARLAITYAAEPGDRVPAYLLLPERRRGDRAPALLCPHQTTAIGKGEPAGVGGDADLHYALELAQRGYVTLAPDYPGFGENRTDPYALGYASASRKGVYNHMRALDLLQSLPEVDPERIGAIGHSLGGHNSLFLAAFDPRARVVVTSCGFTSFARYFGGDLSGWSRRGYMPRIASVYGKDPRRMPFDFGDILAALAPRPVFINAPLHDDNFDVVGVWECLEVARPVYVRAGAEERLRAVHPDIGHAFPPEVRQEAYAFIDRWL